MEIKKRIFKTGTSLCVVLDKIVLSSLNLKAGDYVILNIKKAKK